MPGPWLRAQRPARLEQRVVAVEVARCRHPRVEQHHEPAPPVERPEADDTEHRQRAEQVGRRLAARQPGVGPGGGEVGPAARPVGRLALGDRTGQGQRVVVESQAR
ncbi:hypothetical protein GCM10025868_23750 [Angustibacter aerolatus]|uniref:Uncharacterized protein n=1 Tax=Angustibacter aerolatus TaxID=1162965 RepID=A0ABQ6JIQ4_9ACTN|nr:hypothetical protein GCM10025868_23750 [Angustibacter aerolatus]